MTNINHSHANRYGCDELGRLQRVLVHTPGEELRVINKDNHTQYLFDAVPDIPAFIDEHQSWCELLKNYGVEVNQLLDHVTHNQSPLKRLPNITYMHDIAVVSRKGAILSRMTGARTSEDRVVKEALLNLNIPIHIELDKEDDAFEGCLLLSPSCLFIAHTERHKTSSIAQFIGKALESFDEVILADIPRARRFMHPDTILNRIRHDLVIAYPPTLTSTFLFTRNGVQPLDFFQYLDSHGISMIEVSDSEQRRLACSFVPLDNGVMFHYDTAFDKSTLSKLSEKKVEVIFFHPKALVAGGGSLRCITMRLLRCEGTKETQTNT